MRILFAASEAAPFAKTGGLGDVVGALPAALAQKGVDARVVLPKYGCIPAEYAAQMEFVTHIPIHMGWRSQYCGIFRLQHKGVTFYFIDNEYYFGGPSVYGEMYADIERFTFFSKAVLALMPQVDFRPDILHLNDWQTAVIPVLIDAYYPGDDYYQGIKTVLAIHNLKFQGRYQIDTVRDLCDLPPSYFTPDCLEYYGDANLLKGGILYADYVVTVSHRYMHEICTPAFGEGLQTVLGRRGERLWGITNGIDYTEYNPADDGALEFRYDRRNAPAKKKDNKIFLQRDLGLTMDPSAMLLAMVSRLTEQKGLDLLCDSIEALCAMGLQLVVLGCGDTCFEDAMRYFAGRFPGQVAAQIRFDNGLSHKIYAAADALLMPSAFEPCGLSQLIAMRYGTVPIVRETGGLADTVIPYNAYEDSGTGFSFCHYTREDFLHTISYARDVFQSKTTWNRLMRRCMQADFSWNTAAEKYMELYQQTLS